MDPVTVALKQVGSDEVKSALRSVQDAITALDNHSANSAKRSSNDRVQAIKREASERKKSTGSDQARGGSDSRRQSAFDRALGGNSAGPMRRITSGPTIAEMSGSSGSSLASLAGKAGIAGAAFGLFKGAVDFAADALKQFGGFLISDVIKPAFALETAAVQLENAAGGSIKASEIQEKTRSAALKHNMDPMALFEAASKMIDLTGDAKTSFSLLDTIGTLAKGRGADAGELADFAASLKNFDPNATSEQISGLLMTQLAQGDKGSVPLKEAARLGGRLTAPAAFLAGNTDVRMASMGALMQTARKGFGSTDELATGIGNLINEVSSQKMVGSKKYLNSDGQIGDVASLIGGILSSTGGDAKKIGALGLSDPAAKLVKAYKPAFDEAGKGEKGKEAVETLIRGFMEASTSLEAEKANERKVLQTSGEKWNATIEGLKNKLLDIMPEVQKFVDQFAKIAPQFGGALLTLAKLMIKVANYLAGLIGETAVDENTATGESRGEYKINPETGKFEFVKQSELNAQKKNNIFDPASYEGEGLKLKGMTDKPIVGPNDTAPDGLSTSGAQASILSPLLPSGAPPAIGALPSASSGPAPIGSKDISSALSQLDELGPKANKLGLMFDKLTASGNDVARSTPIGQR